MLVKERLCNFFYKKETKKYYGAKLIFILFSTFLVKSFLDHVPKKILFTEFMSVLDQNGRIKALGFLVA